MSTTPRKPNAAWRTSSTVWNSGLKLAATWTHSGRPLSGKNVPATRNSGVSPALMM